MTTFLHTSSAGGVVIHDNRVLVIKSPLRNTIEFPKGTIESDEPLELTAIREVREETGYDVTILDDLGGVTFEFQMNDKRYRKTVYYYLLGLADDKVYDQNLQKDEDFMVEWLTFDEARSNLTFEEAKIILSKALSRFKSFTE